MVMLSLYNLNAVLRRELIEHPLSLKKGVNFHNEN